MFSLSYFDVVLYVYPIDCLPALFALCFFIHLFICLFVCLLLYSNISDCVHVFEIPFLEMYAEENDQVNRNSFISFVGIFVIFSLPVAAIPQIPVVFSWHRSLVQRLFGLHIENHHFILESI